MSRLARIGVSIIERIIDDKVKDIEDEKMRGILTNVLDVSIEIIRIFIDKNKDNKAQLKELKPFLEDKALTITELILNIKK